MLQCCGSFLHLFTSLNMRKGINIPPSRAGVSLWVSRRFINRHHSPDRTFSQEIQDRQNTFQWSSRHVFRPHQHFSYDPSNWSRTLEEKTKKGHTLSLVERVQLMQEHETERCASIKVIEQASENVSQQPSNPLLTNSEDEVLLHVSPDEDTEASPARQPSQDGDAPRNIWETVPLQDLVEEVQRLQRLLYSRRYAGNASLARRERQTEEFRIVLWHLFELLSGAVLGETVTVDACVYGWFTLLRHVEPLVEAMVSAAPSLEGPQEAVRHVFVALQKPLLYSLEKGGVTYKSAAAGALSLEALIELLSIAASPFVRNCGDTFQGHLPAQGTLEEVAEWVSAAARQRAQVADDVAAEDRAALREWLDPTHLEAWAAAVKHLHNRGSVVAHVLPGLQMQVEHAALYFTGTLRSVTGVTLGGHVKESLQSSVQSSAQITPQHKPGKGESETARVQFPKAVVLDATAPPRGIQTSPTECDDVSHVLAASMIVLHLLCELDCDAAGGEEERVRRFVTECLQMATQAPNYDLEGGVVVPWACALLETGVLMSVTKNVDDEDCRGAHKAHQKGTESGTRLSLRFLLLLSRLSFYDITDRPELGRLVLLLALWPEPCAAIARERAEWRRLRGIVMKSALVHLTCEDLTAAAAKVDGVSTWVETLAFGEYDGVVPLELWRAACQRWLPSSNRSVLSSLPNESLPTPSATITPPTCSAAMAHALLLLGARYFAREEAGHASAMLNIHSFHTAERVAEGVAVYLQDRPEIATTLLHSADAWDAVISELPETLHSFLSAMQAVVRQEMSQEKVINF